MKQDPLWIEQETVEIRPERNTPPPPRSESFFGPGAKDLGIYLGIVILAIAAVPFIAAWWVTRWILLPVACVASIWYLLSTINFDAPLTLGGAIVIGVIVLSAVGSSLH
jgi:hypothetical protein